MKGACLAANFVLFDLRTKLAELGVLGSKLVYEGSQVAACRRQ